MTKYKSKSTESLKIAKKKLIQRYFHYRTKKQSIHFVKDAVEKLEGRRGGRTCFE